MTERPALGRSAEPEGPTGLPPEARELLVPQAPLGVPLPAYGGRSLPNVVSSIVRALGAEPSSAAVPALEPSVDPFAGRRAEGPVLLFVVDGLGYDRLLASGRRPEGVHARSWLPHTRPLTSTFPTTTTVALASLSTAAPPSRHGLVGYRQFFPRFGSVVDVLRMSPTGVAADDALLGPAWTPAEVLAAPTVYRHGVPGSVAVSRDRFEGRGFTRAIYDGAAYEPYSGWSDFADALAHVLSRDTPPPLVTAYWDELDTVEHLRGPAAGSVDLEIDRLGELLGFVGRAVGPARSRATTVLLTADHGLVPVDPARQTAVDAEPKLLRHLARPPTGDRRVGFLKARDGEVELLREAVSERFPAGTRIVPSEEAIRLGLFGPPPYHPELAETVADLVVLVPSPGGITYSLPGRKPGRRHLLGGHGGLEPAEFLVPLVSGRLAELGSPPRSG